MNGEIGRRRALQVAALGAAAAVGGGWGTWTSLLAPSARAFRPSSERSLWEPPVLASAGGILEVDLTAGVGVTLAGRRTRALGYNGTSPGPTLRVAPGDVLRVMLANDLEETTNLHTHGLHVSPRGRGDDPFRMVEPGQRAGYEYAVPRDHPTGTFWYHPHHHGAVAGQLFGGLFGAVVVAAADEPASPAERVLVISDITLTGDGEVAGVGLPAVMMGREGDLVLVNGQLRPRLEATEGAQERWRVVNACTSRFLELELDDHSLGLAGYDGQALGAPQDRATVALAPGNRADLFVRLPDAGTFTLRTRGHDRGGMGMMGMMGDGASGTSTEAVLATVRVAARPTSAADPPALPQADGGSLVTTDLRVATIARRRTITVTMGMGSGMGGGGAMTFGFDGLAFHPGRVDQRVALGTVEEWTLVNASSMDHPFHLHVWPMQVVDGPGFDPSGRPEWRDVVTIPARGQVTVRIRFADFAGRTVYHCHILDHEDHGMMGVVEVAG